MDEVEALLGHNEELSNDGIVLYRSDDRFDLWVIGTKGMINDLSHSAG